MYEIKWNILGPKPEHVKTVKIFNRVIRWTSQGVTYEADQKHVKKIINGLDLINANGISTPFTKEKSKAPQRRTKIKRSVKVKAVPTGALLPQEIIWVMTAQTCNMRSSNAQRPCQIPCGQVGNP